MTGPTRVAFPNLPWQQVANCFRGGGLYVYDRAALVVWRRTLNRPLWALCAHCGCSAKHWHCFEALIDRRMSPDERSMPKSAPPAHRLRPERTRYSNALADASKRALAGPATQNCHIFAFDDRGKAEALAALTHRARILRCCLNLSGHAIS